MSFHQVIHAEFAQQAARFGGKHHLGITAEGQALEQEGSQRRGKRFQSQRPCLLAMIFPSSNSRTGPDPLGIA